MLKEKSTADGKPERRDPERRDRREHNRGRDRRATSTPAEDAGPALAPNDAASDGPAAGPTVGSTFSPTVGPTVGPTFRSGETPETEGTAETRPTNLAPPTQAGARLGERGLTRLRTRYAETVARIDERIADPERQSELKVMAERLNPDGWVTDTDVTAGLESYEATFAELRTHLRLGPNSQAARTGTKEPE